MPGILIFGGVRPIGRLIVLEAIQLGIYDEIRVVDEEPPEDQYFQSWELTAFENIDVMILNIGGDVDNSLLRMAFQRNHHTEWDVVVNTYSNSKVHRSKSEHMEDTIRPAVQIARAARSYGCGVFVHISYFAAMTHLTEVEKIREDFDYRSCCKSNMAWAQYEAENSVRSVLGLPSVILRAPTIYGNGYIGGFSEALVAIRYYCRGSRPRMRIPFKASEYANTVHALDLARAVLHASHWYLNNDVQGVRIFNIADETDTDRVAFTKHIAEALDLPVAIMSTTERVFFRMMARTSSLAITRDDLINKAWDEDLRESRIKTTPITPLPDSSGFLSPRGIRLDPTLFCQTTRFTYQVPFFTANKVRSAIDYWRLLNVWPEYTSPSSQSVDSRATT